MRKISWAVASVSDVVGRKEFASKFYDWMSSHRPSISALSNEALFFGGIVPEEMFARKQKEYIDLGEVYQGEQLRGKYMFSAEYYVYSPPVYGHDAKERFEAWNKLLPPTLGAILDTV